MTEFGHKGFIAAGCCIDYWGAGPFEIIVGKKRYRFEDSERFGPAILGRDGNPCDRQPGERSPFWKAHFQWVKGGRRLADDGKTCIWDEPQPTVVRRERFKGRVRLFVVQHGDLEYGGITFVRD